MKQVKAKFYPKTKMIVPIPEELTLLGEQSPVDKARAQKGVDENFDEHGKFLILDYIHEEEVHYEYDVEKGHKEAQEVSEEEWNN